MVAGLVAFVVVFVLRRPIAAGWRALLGLNLCRVVFVAALFTVAWLGAFPPWVFTFSGPGASQVVRAGPRAFILSPPPQETPGIRNGVTVDLSRLLIEWIVVGAVAFALGGLLPRRRPESRAAASMEAGENAPETAPSRTEESAAYEPAAVLNGAATLSDHSDDPVAWSDHPFGKVTTRPEEHAWAPRESGKVMGEEDDPRPPGTGLPSPILKNGMTLKEFGNQLAEEMAANLRKRTMDESSVSSPKARPPEAAQEIPGASSTRRPPRSWVVRKIRAMDTATRGSARTGRTPSSTTPEPKE